MIRRSDANISSSTLRHLIPAIALICSTLLADRVQASSTASGIVASAAISMASAERTARTPSGPRHLTTRYFNGRPVVPSRIVRMRVTAYSPDERSCGTQADGITASGYSVETNGGDLVAADARLFRFGSMLSVPGYAGGAIVPVLDRGGVIKGTRLDVLYPTHLEARRWGVQYIYVTEWAYADGLPSGFRRIRR